MTDNTHKVPLNLRIDSDLRARLDTRSDLERRTLTAIIEMALEQYLAEPPR